MSNFNNSTNLANIFAVDVRKIEIELTQKNKKLDFEKLKITIIVKEYNMKN